MAETSAMVHLQTVFAEQEALLYHKLRQVRDLWRSRRSKCEVAQYNFRSHSLYRHRQNCPPIVANKCARMDKLLSNGSLQKSQVTARGDSEAKPKKISSAALYYPFLAWSPPCCTRTSTPGGINCRHHSLSFAQPILARSTYAPLTLLTARSHI